MCCGRNRQARQYNVPNRVAAWPVAGNAGLPPGSAFEYLGRTALTVVGPVSGARYRFDRPGSRIHVDPRDRTALQRIPVLKLVG
jgi:hypothetical protein